MTKIPKTKSEIVRKWLANFVHENGGHVPQDDNLAEETQIIIELIEDHNVRF